MEVGHQTYQHLKVATLFSRSPGFIVFEMALAAKISGNPAGLGLPNSYIEAIGNICNTYAKVQDLIFVVTRGHCLIIEIVDKIPGKL